MEDDYIPALEAAKVLKMSPARFADLLRKERERLPVEIDYGGALKNNPYSLFALKGLKAFYEEIPANNGFLYALKIHRLDWNTFFDDWKEAKVKPEQAIGEMQARIAELETKLATCRKQLEEARAVNTSGNEDVGKFFEAYPVCRLIYDLYHAGKNQAEIRRELTGKGYSNAQTGFLTQKDTIQRSDETIKQSVKRSKKSLEK